MKFGCRVEVKAVLDRWSRFFSTRRSEDEIKALLHNELAWHERSRTYRRVWVRRAYPSSRQGLYIGYRTLANGTTTYHGGAEDGYTEWKGEEFIKVALVVFNERTNPVYVLFDDVKELPE